jgi:hypothetical protein
LLDVDCFEGTVESHILECNVFDASVVRSGGNRADCHAYSVDYFDVARYDILSALSDFASTIHGLNSDCVVEVGNLDALNQDVLSRRVNTVSVQGERWEF